MDGYDSIDHIIKEKRKQNKKGENTENEHFLEHSAEKTVLYLVGTYFLYVLC